VNSTDPESAIETERRQGEQKPASHAPKTLGSTSVPDEKQEETRLSPGLSAGETYEAGSISHIASELSFVCILIPRFSDHYLIGDITESLSEWMKETCISYGWRLDAISVRPGYLEWIMSVPPNTNPAHLMKIFRQHTSQKIFEDFPRFKQKNVSGQFWAPGNFVVTGNQLQTPEVVNNFILQTRRQQGIV